MTMENYAKIFRVAAGNTIDGGCVDRVGIWQLSIFIFYALNVKNWNGWFKRDKFQCNSAFLHCGVGRIHHSH